MDFKNGSGVKLECFDCGSRNFVGYNGSLLTCEECGQFFNTKDDWPELERKNSEPEESSEQPTTPQGSTLPQISALQQEIYSNLPADRMYSREELLSYVKRAETSAVA